MHMEPVYGKGAIRTVVVYRNGKRSKEVELTLAALAPVGATIELFGRYWEVERVIYPVNALVDLARMYVFLV